MALRRCSTIGAEPARVAVHCCHAKYIAFLLILLFCRCIEDCRHMQDVIYIYVNIYMYIYTYIGAAAWVEPAGRAAAHC